LFLTSNQTKALLAEPQAGYVFGALNAYALNKAIDNNIIFDIFCVKSWGTQGRSPQIKRDTH
jgi:hypothetical protein